MFRLMKLAAWIAAGYAIYELYEGFSRWGGARHEFARDAHRKEGRMGMLTGERRGTTEQSEEPSGMSASHTVGRGVTGT
jgi:hypothetical protein